MTWMVRSILVWGLFALGFTAFAQTPVSAEKLIQCGSGDGATLKKMKELHDGGALGTFLEHTSLRSCMSPGRHCTNSGECCGASFCDGGFCTDPGISCRGPGEHCSNSGECCGASFCNDGFCSNPGTSCMPSGTHCTNSGECCGASFCNDGFCS